MELLETLTTDLVLTAVQLARRGQLQEARDRDLPSVQLTCRVRSNDPTGDRLLKFVAVDPEHLQLAPRELMHLAGLAETRALITLEPGERWHLLALNERLRGPRMDAEIVREPYTDDCGVEFDAGYSRGQIERKLRAMSEGHYTRILWATSIHERVETVMETALKLMAAGHLPGIRQVRTVYVNVWADSDPYNDRPRCHKAYALTYDTPATPPG